MWGEALILQNRSDLALTKFEEANKYAPRWGRLHLKWGEALNYVGKTGEARKQFALAASLDLTPEDVCRPASLRSLGARAVPAGCWGMPPIVGSGRAEIPGPLRQTAAKNREISK